MALIVQQSVFFSSFIKERIEANEVQIVVDSVHDAERLISRGKTFGTANKFETT